MYALILTLAFCSPPVERAYFLVQLETNTDVTFFLNGQRLEHGKTYCTEPLTEVVCVELEVRFVDGGQVKTKMFWLELDPGYKTVFTVQLYANPPRVMAC